MTSVLSVDARSVQTRVMDVAESTTASEISVGAAAVRRWLRPVTYQDTPQNLLPAELRDAPVPGLSRPEEGWT